MALHSPFQFSFGRALKLLHSQSTDPKSSSKCELGRFSINEPNDQFFRKYLLQKNRYFHTCRLTMILVPTKASQTANINLNRKQQNQRTNTTRRQLTTDDTLPLRTQIKTCVQISYFKPNRTMHVVSMIP